MLNRENISTNHALNQEFVSASLSMNSDYDAGTRNLLADVNGNLKFLHLIVCFHFIIFFCLSLI